MEKIIIIGSGFSALAAYLKFKKYDPIIISSSNHSYLKKNFNIRKNLNINKIFTKNANSYGNLTYKLNNNTKLHDRISHGGNTNLWGGFIETSNLPQDFLEKLKKNRINLKKLNINSNGYSSNKSNIRQLCDYKNNILDSSLIFDNILNGFLHSFKVENNRIELKLFNFKKNSFETIYASKLLLAISFPQLIDLFYRSNFFNKNMIFSLSEFYHSFKITFKRNFENFDLNKQVVIKYDLIRALKHFFGLKKSIDKIKIKIPMFVDQIFYFKKRSLKLKLNTSLKEIKEFSSNENFGDSIHYCNLELDEININHYLKNISKNIIGISAPFVKQNQPGPISNDIVNNIWNKYD